MHNESTPPTIAASHRPAWIIRAALPKTLADEEHAVFVAAVGEHFRQRGRVRAGDGGGTILGEFLDGFAAAEIDTEEVLGDAVDPDADGGVVLQLGPAFPAAAPGGLGDFLGEFVLDTTRLQESHRSGETELVGGGELLWGEFL